MSKETNDPKITKCPVLLKNEKGELTDKCCDKDLLHGASYATYGTNERRKNVTGPALTQLKRIGALSKSVTAATHFFTRHGTKEALKYRQPNSNGVAIEGPAPESIEGHHLVTVEAVSSKEWYCLFYIMSYNINNPPNIVLFPADMLSACHYGVPRHKSNHSATFGDDKEYMNYVQSVEKLIYDVIDNYRTGFYCHKKLKKKDFVDFHTEMLDFGKTVLKKLKTFQWTISADGRDYMSGGVGCYGGCRSLEVKDGLMSSVLNELEGYDNYMSKSKKIVAHFKGKDLPHSGKGLIRAMESDMFRNSPNKYKPCDRNHSNEGCELPLLKVPNSISTETYSFLPVGNPFIQWDKCKYDDIDEAIKEMKD